MRCWRCERASAALASGLAAVALLGLAAGCGNEKRDFRVDKLNPLVRQLAERRATLAVVLRSSRPGRAQDARALREQVAGVAGVARRIAVLDPPEGSEAKFRRYVRANAAFVASLRRFVEAFAGRAGQRRQREIAVRVQIALAAANRAQTALQRSLR